MPNATLIGWGHYVPETVVTNDDLAQIVDTSDEWIRSRSGIERRHFASPEQATSDLCVEAATRALKRAGIDPLELDLVLVATSSPDHLTPPVSSQVQDRIGARCGAMTLMVGCTGFVYGLVTASQFIQTGAYRTILVVGAEVISKNLDMTDRTTCVLFGDGAGAVVLQATEAPCGVRAFELGSDGAQFEAIIAPCPGTRHPVSQEAVDNRTHYLRMDGRAVFKFATTTMGESLQRVMAQAGAGAVVLQATEAPCGVRAFELGSDGAQFEAIIAPCPGTRHPVSQEAVDNRTHYLRMDGRAVFKFATTTMGESLQRVMAQAGLGVDDIDLFIPHQANARIIEYAAKSFGLPPEKVVMNVADYGNTSAATIPIALSEALTAGRAAPGDTLAFVGFGAGLTWAAALFDLGPMEAQPAGARARRASAGDGGFVEGLIA